MFYRPNTFEVEKADSFVCSKFFDFEPDRKDEEGLVTMDQQLRNILNSILKLAKLNRTTGFITADEDSFNGRKQ